MVLVIYEGEIAGEFPPEATEEQLGIAMTGGHQSFARAGRAVSTLGDELEAAAEESADAALRSAARLMAFRRGLGGFLIPLLTTLIAFIAAGGIVLLTGHDPLCSHHVRNRRGGPGRGGLSRRRSCPCSGATHCSRASTSGSSSPSRSRWCSGW